MSVMSNPRQGIRESFFNALFSLLGYVAQCDGHITRGEIKRLQFYIKKMNLTDDEKQQALLLFKSGTTADFNVNQTIQDFKKNTTPKLIHILLVYLITMARADGFLVKKEMYVIQRIAREMDYRSIVFNHLLRMLSEQDEIFLRSRQQNEIQRPAQDTYEPPKTARTANDADKNHSYNQAKYQSQDLQEAYETLGITAEMTEDEIRRIYKKLVSQFHPDKLINQGLAPDALAVATGHFKKIQAAYGFIKKYRSIYSAT